MPIVRVDLWPGRTKEQKAEIARLFTEALTNVMSIPAEATNVIFQDIPKEDWAIGGILASDRK